MMQLYEYFKCSVLHRVTIAIKSRLFDSSFYRTRICWYWTRIVRVIWKRIRVRFF